MTILDKVSGRGLRGSRGCPTGAMSNYELCAANWRSCSQSRVRAEAELPNGCSHRYLEWRDSQCSKRSKTPRVQCIYCGPKTKTQTERRVHVCRLRLHSFPCRRRWHKLIKNSPLWQTSGCHRHHPSRRRPTAGPACPCPCRCQVSKSQS